MSNREEDLDDVVYENDVLHEPTTVPDGLRSAGFIHHVSMGISGFTRTRGTLGIWHRL